MEWSGGVPGSESCMEWHLLASKQNVHVGELKVVLLLGEKDIAGGFAK